MTARDRAEDAWAERQAERDCAEMGLPVYCCGEWPECSHMLAAVTKLEAERKHERDGTTA